MASTEEKQYSVGLDLGGTKMLAAVVDSDFRIIARSRKKTKGHEGSEAGVKRMKETVYECLEEAGIDKKDLLCLGLGSPGPLDFDTGTIRNAPNLGWKNVPIRSLLNDEFQCPVAIANDVDAGVFAESLFGAGRKARCVVGVFPGTGVGGGCVFKGEIIRGTSGSCMEIGHIQVIQNGPRCGCGRFGCLEAVAGRLAIAAGAALASYRGQAPNLRENAGTDISKIRSGTLASAIRKGDAVIEDLVADSARYVGIAVGTIVNLLAPDVVVLGGGLVEAMPDLYTKTVEKYARKNAMASFAKSFEVHPAKLGDDAGVLGAAAWAHRKTTLNLSGRKLS